MPLSDQNLELTVGMYDAIGQIGRGIDNGLKMLALTNALADVVLDLAKDDPEAMQTCSILFHRHFVKCLNVKQPPLTEFIDAEG